MNIKNSDLQNCCVFSVDLTKVVFSSHFLGLFDRSYVSVIRVLVIHSASFTLLPISKGKKLD